MSDKDGLIDRTSTVSGSIADLAASGRRKHSDAWDKESVKRKILEERLSLSELDTAERKLASEVSDVMKMYPKIIKKLRRPGNTGLKLEMAHLKDKIHGSTGAEKEHLIHLQEKLKLINQASAAGGLSLSVLALAGNLVDQAMQTSENKASQIIKNDVKPTMNILGGSGPIIGAFVPGAAIAGPIGVAVGASAHLVAAGADLAINSRAIDKLKSKHIHNINTIDIAIRSYSGLSDFSKGYYSQLNDTEIESWSNKVDEPLEKEAVKKLLEQRNAAIKQITQEIANITEKRAETVGTALQDAGVGAASAVVTAATAGLLTGGIVSAASGPIGLGIIGAVALDYALDAVPKFDAFLYRLSGGLVDKMLRPDKPWYSPSKIGAALGFGVLTTARGILLPIRPIAAMYNDPVGIFTSVWNAPNMHPAKKALLLPIAAAGTTLGLVSNVALRFPVRGVKALLGGVAAVGISIWTAARAGLSKLSYKLGISKVDESAQRLRTIKDTWKGLGKSIKKDFYDRLVDPIKNAKSPAEAFAYDAKEPTTGFIDLLEQAVNHKESPGESPLRPKIDTDNKPGHSPADLHLYIASKENEIKAELRERKPTLKGRDYEQAFEKATKKDKKLQLAYVILAITSERTEGEAKVSNPLLAMHRLEHNNLDKAEKKDIGVFGKMFNAVKSAFSKTDDSRYNLHSSWFGESELKKIHLERKAALFTRPKDEVLSDLKGVLNYQIDSFMKKCNGKISDLSDNDYYKYKALEHVKVILKQYSSGQMHTPDIKSKIKEIEDLMAQSSIRSSTLATSETVTILDYARQFLEVENKRKLNVDIKNYSQEIIDGSTVFERDVLNLKHVVDAERSPAMLSDFSTYNDPLDDIIKVITDYDDTNSLRKVQKILKESAGLEEIKQKLESKTEFAGPNRDLAKELVEKLDNWAKKNPFFKKNKDSLLKAVEDTLGKHNSERASEKCENGVNRSENKNRTNM